MVDPITTVSGTPNFILNIITLIGIGITAVLWIFKRGKQSGLDQAGEQRIQTEIKKLCEKVTDSSKDADRVHGELKKDIHAIDNKIDSLQSSFDTFKEIVIKKI